MENNRSPRTAEFWRWPQEISRMKEFNSYWEKVNPGIRGAGDIATFD
jgi:hypothetical protein